MAALNALQVVPTLRTAAVTGIAVAITAAGMLTGGARADTGPPAASTGLASSGFASSGRAAAASPWAAEARYRAVSPTVVLDTRTGGGTRRGPLAPGRAVGVPVLGRAGVPSSGVGAVEIEIVASDAAKAAAVGAYPAGAAVPTAGLLPVPPRTTATTRTTVKPGASGRIQVLALRNALQVTVRLVGWFAADGGYTPVVPTRIADTSTGGGVPKGALGGGDYVAVPLYGRAGVPTTGGGQVAVLVTATGVRGTGTVAVAPLGGVTSGALAFRASRSTTALVVTAPGSDGDLSATVTGGTAHVTVDVLGWVPPPPRIDNGIQLVSLGATGRGVNGYVGHRASISVDGRYVAYSTIGDNSYPGAGPGLFRRDMTTGTIVPVVAGPDVYATGLLSRDGQTAAYTAPGTGDREAAYVRALPGGAARRVDVTPAGAPSTGDARVAAIGADGRWVLFSSNGADLVAGVTDRLNKLFLRDVAAGTTVLVARCSDDDSQGCDATMTPDAARVVYEDVRSRPTQAYVWDRATGAATRVSSTRAGAAGDGDSGTLSITDDGRLVAFESTATNLLDVPVGAPVANGGAPRHAYLRDLSTGTTTLLDRTPTGAVANGETDGLDISGDGSRVAIVSSAANLTSPAVVSRYGQIYVRDLATGATRLVSRTPYGMPGNGNWDTPERSGSWGPVLTPDGAWVVFGSQSTDLIVGGTGPSNVFRAELG